MRLPREAVMYNLRLMAAAHVTTHVTAVRVIFRPCDIVDIAMRISSWLKVGGWGSPLWLTRIVVTGMVMRCLRVGRDLVERCCASWIRSIDDPGGDSMVCGRIWTCVVVDLFHGSDDSFDLFLRRFPTSPVANVETQNKEQAEYRNSASGSSCNSSNREWGLLCVGGRARV